MTLNAGRSMEGEPSGANLGVDFGTWKLDGSLGVMDGVIVGGAFATAQLNATWSAKAGDQVLPVGIPTEAVFNSGVLARGLSLLYTPNLQTRVAIFAGMAGEGNASTEVLFFTPRIPLGSISLDHYIDNQKHWLVFGRGLFGSQQTILSGVLYQTKKLQAGVAAGTGSNQPHAEALLNFKDEKWDIRGAYRYSGERFELLTLPEFRYAQEDRANVDARWLPLKETSFTAEHHEYLEPLDPESATQGVVRGSTDMMGGMFSLQKVGLGANLFESRFEGIYTSAASFLSSLRLTKAISLSANYYVPLHAINPMPMLNFNTDEKINRRLRLAQFANRVNGRWTANYGGGLTFDRFDASVGYGTYFTPLAPGGGRFQQEMNLNGHVNLGRFQVGVQTYVQPDGRLLYGFELKTFYFHPTSNTSLQAPQNRSVALGNYLITGEVRLAVTGKPVSDVPVRIGNDTVFSDELGQFSLRVARRRTYKIQLSLDRQVGVHFLENVSGPSEVVAGTDADPGVADFVVRIDPNKKAVAPAGGVVIAPIAETPESSSQQN